VGIFFVPLGALFYGFATGERLHKRISVGLFIGFAGYAFLMFFYTARL
jgi:drug/metabolite transporter (DMT)-like permease